MLAYFRKLEERMDVQGFPENDPLRLEVIAARDAVQTLLIKSHNLTCSEQTGGRPRAKQAAECN